MADFFRYTGLPQRQEAHSDNCLQILPNAPSYSPRLVSIPRMLDLFLTKRSRRNAFSADTFPTLDEPCGFIPEFGLASGQQIEDSCIIPPECGHPALPSETAFKPRDWDLTIPFPSSHSGFSDLQVTSSFSAVSSSSALASRTTSESTLVSSCADWAPHLATSESCPNFSQSFDLFKSGSRKLNLQSSFLPSATHRAKEAFLCGPDEEYLQAFGDQE